MGRLEPPGLVSQTKVELLVAPEVQVALALAVLETAVRVVEAVVVALVGTLGEHTVREVTVGQAALAVRAVVSLLSTPSGS